VRERDLELSWWRELRELERREWRAALELEPP
jgi:hypothetical protein